MRVVAGLIDAPYMRHEVARKRHENAECGSVINEWQKVLLALISLDEKETNGYNRN